MDIEKNKEQLAERKKELEEMCKIKSPSIFNQTLVKIAKKADIFIDFASCTQKEKMNYSVYVEMCQIISDRYNAAKFKAIATVAEAFPVKLKKRTQMRGFLSDVMLEDDVDKNEQIKYFKLWKT